MKPNRTNRQRTDRYRSKQWSLLILVAFLTPGPFATFGTEANFRLLKSLACNAGEGKYPQFLTEGSDGALYGGADMSCPPDDQALNNEELPPGGFLFKMNKDGSGFTRLYTFSGAAWGGAQSLFEGTDGYLYGTAELQISGFAHKQIFKIKRDGNNYQVLHSFEPYGDGGGDVVHDRLNFATEHLLYGIHAALSENSAARSFVFELSSDGSSYNVVKAGSESERFTSVFQANDRLLYGTSTDYLSGYDTVFKIRTDGTEYTPLYRATNGCSGCVAVLLVKDGILYGSEPDGLFQLRTDSAARRLIAPVGATSLFDWSDGFLYGTDGAVIFKVGKDGSGFQMILQNAFPQDFFLNEILLASNGSFYSVTPNGGQYADGAIFVTPVLPNLPRLLRPGPNFPEVLLHFASSPGSTNEIQRTDLLSGEWKVISTIQVPVNGIAEFNDATAPPGRAFYRILRR